MLSDTLKSVLVLPVTYVSSGAVLVDFLQSFGQGIAAVEAAATHCIAVVAIIIILTASIG